MQNIKASHKVSPSRHAPQGNDDLPIGERAVDLCRPTRTRLPSLHSHAVVIKSKADGQDARLGASVVKPGRDDGTLKKQSLTPPLALDVPEEHRADPCASAQAHLPQVPSGTGRAPLLCGP